MIKKYKKIGTILLGLSCLTGGFFMPVENNSLISTVQAAEKSDKLVCNMTTKELFNVVYGYLREKDLTITFAMPPQSADDYGLIIVQRGGTALWANSENTAAIQGRRFNNFYIDKGSSRDFAILNVTWYMGDYNYVFDYTRYGSEGFSRKDAYYPEEGNMNKLVGGLVNFCRDTAEKEIQEYYNDLSVKVKKESSTAPSRSKER